jgi:hypothetical protein
MDTRRPCQQSWDILGAVYTTLAVIVQAKTTVDADMSKVATDVGPLAVVVGLIELQQMVWPGKDKIANSDGSRMRMMMVVVMAMMDNR